MYQPTYDSVHQHKLPKWFDEAKFGIFVHWSLFSVPAFAAEQTRDISESMAEDMSATFANNPYAEWYLNSLRIPGSPTQAFHKKHYGDRSYFDFQRDFEAQNAACDVNGWAQLMQDAGARYCVLVTKHHDGYTLWPTDTPNPIIPGYFSKRDFVGELTEAVRSRGMKMGLYYSGVYDWTFKTDCPIDSPRGFIEHQRMPVEYVRYSVAHLYELIDKYRPSILWNDIAFPYGYDLNELFAHYYNTVEDGVIDDRWNQIKVPVTEDEWRELERTGGGFNGNNTTHYDFITPEYKLLDEVPPIKWECTRGIGRSFGFNRTECGSDYLSGAQVIEMLVKVVSRGGNLLLNIGPRADGSIPYEQALPLRETGRWLARNGEAIYGTHPNDVLEYADADGCPVCMTARDDARYAIALRETLPGRYVIRNMRVDEGARAELLGVGRIDVRAEGGDAVFTLPENAPAQPAQVIKIARG